MLNGDDALLNTVHPAVPVYRCGEGAGCNVRIADVREHGIEAVSCTVHTERASYDLRIRRRGGT